VPAVLDVPVEFMLPTAYEFTDEIISVMVARKISASDQESSGSTTAAKRHVSVSAPYSQLIQTSARCSRHFSGTTARLRRPLPGRRGNFLHPR